MPPAAAVPVWLGLAGHVQRVEVGISTAGSAPTARCAGRSSSRHLDAARESRHESRCAIALPVRRKTCRLPDPHQTTSARWRPKATSHGIQADRLPGDAHHPRWRFLPCRGASIDAMIIHQHPMRIDPAGVSAQEQQTDSREFLDATVIGLMGPSP
jgi:hypothetical protein